MSSAGRISISSCFQHGLQDGYLSYQPHVKGGLFPLIEVFRVKARERFGIQHQQDPGSSILMDLGSSIGILSSDSVDSGSFP